MQIAFFDSGIGGLTVLHQAKRKMPREDYLYYADTDHVPYGRKTKEEIRQYVQEALAPFDLRRYCTVVLGCTHFNYFKDSFHKILPEDIAMLDGSDGTVNNLQHVLAEKNLLETGTGQVQYVTSGRWAEQLRPKYERLLQRLEEMLTY